MSLACLPPWRPAFALALMCSFAACGSGSSPPGSVPGPGPQPGAEAGAGQEAGGAPRRGGGGGPIAGDDDGGGISGDGAPTASDGGVPADAGADQGGWPADAPPRDTAADLAAGPDSPPDTAPADMCGSGGSCDMLASDYTAAISRAQSCNVSVKGQCAQQRPRDLWCGGCSLWVNTTAELDAIRAKFTDGGCGKCRRFCPAIACRLLTGGVCRVRGPLPGPGAPAPIIGEAGICADENDPQPL
jgi:hypothetical protein